MIATSLKPLLVALCMVIGFLFVHGLLRQDRVYAGTLGRIAQNYQRTGTWEHSEVIRTDRPFEAITSDSLRTWDAGIYACIKERLYAPGTECYGSVRAAFFPLLPMVWRITGLSAIGMSLLNYALFAIGLAILIKLLHPELPSIATGVLLTLPSTIIFGIPYSEALFMLTAAIMAWGMVKKRYAIHFIGALLLAMVRPATLFVLIAVVMSDVLVAFRSGPRAVLMTVVRSAAPFLLGYTIVFLVQYLTSGSERAMLDAQAHWKGGLHPVEGIKDWSQESFGLSSFAVFFVCLPALLFALRSILYSLLTRSEGNAVPHRQRLLSISCFYLTGILLFTILTSRGDLHSFHRFTLASPFFYIAALVALRQMPSYRPGGVGIAVLLSMTLLTAFLHVVEYGGERLQFPFAGMFLAIAAVVFFVTMHRMSPVLRNVLGGVLIGADLVWAAYLLNCFVVDGWLFT